MYIQSYKELIVWKKSKANFSTSESLLEEIQKMLITMIKKLNAKR